MPSQPDPNSPYMDTRLQATMGVKAPGSPSSAGKPGVQAGNVSYPAPPAVASAPPGRPAAPATPKPAAAPPQTGGPQPQATQPGAAQSGAPAVAPLGTAVAGANGHPSDVLLSPEGDARYRQAVLQGRNALGPLPRIFRHPTLPEMPFSLGQSNFNPFTGSWVHADDTAGGAGGGMPPGGGM